LSDPLNAARDRGVAAAVRTGFPFPAIDRPGMLEVPEFAIRLHVIPEGGATRGDRALQDIADRHREPFRPATLNRIGLTPRRKTGMVKSFADIDVAESCNDSLVQQSTLDRRTLALEGRGQDRSAEGVTERFRPEVRQQGMRLQSSRCDEIHDSEAPRIVETNLVALVCLEDDVIVFVEILRRAVQVRALYNRHASRHAEMAEKRFAAVQGDQNVLGPPSHGNDPVAFQSGDKVLRKRKAQVRPPLQDALQNTSLQIGLKAPHDGFDFGQLGHLRQHRIWKCNEGLGPQDIRFRRTGTVRQFAPWPPSRAQAMVRAMTEENTQARADAPERPTTHFGAQEVPEAEKATLVQGVFRSVASNYDLMNDLMSGGIHRLWKADMVRWLNPRPGMQVLDVAGGTGDIAFRIRDHVEAAHPDSAPNGGVDVTICDLTPEMLAQGRDRAIDRGHLKGITWICGDAQRLPFADRSTDAYTIAFGLRNVTEIERALAEARRVLRPGGRFLCLEFSQVVLPVLRELYDLYSYQVLPALGATVANDRDSYQYLVESIRRFPDQETLVAMIEDAGLDNVRYRNLSGGIAALHSAWRI